MVFDLSYALVSSAQTAAYYFPYDRRFMPVYSREPYPNIDHTLNLATVFQDSASIQDLLDRMSSAAKAWTTNATILHDIATPIVDLLPGVASSSQYNLLCGYVNSLAPNTCKTKAYNPRPPLKLDMNYDLMYPGGPLTAFEYSNVTTVATAVTGTVPSSAKTGTATAFQTSVAALKPRQGAPLQRREDDDTAPGELAWLGRIAVLYTTSTNRFPKAPKFEAQLDEAFKQFAAANPQKAEKLGVGRIVEAFQQLPSTDPEPISELAGIVIGDVFFAFPQAKMLDLTNKRMRIKNFATFYPKAAQRMEAHSVQQLLKEFGATGIPLDTLNAQAYYNEKKDSLSFRYTALLGAGNEEAGAQVQDKIGNLLARYRGAVGKPEPGSTYSLAKLRLFQVTKNLNSVTKETRPDGIASVSQEGPYNDAVFAETIGGGLTQDLKNYFSQHDLSFPDTDTFTAADLVTHLTNQLRGGPSTQQLGFLHGVCDIVSNMVDLDDGIASDGSINGAVQDVAEAAAELNEYDIDSVGKTNRRLKYNKAKQSPRRQATGSRPSNNQHH
ncbi:hypothetical protein HDU77_000921 [Chytriomyces hyalinus]|nr:hypothetical protein HDU77_000919 [Chytriomyces hyalinus]KAJ3261293.1 hypothetical protein HDU77_000921 [Chytriomyces hyalinus]